MDGWGARPLRWLSVLVVFRKHRIQSAACARRTKFSLWWVADIFVDIRFLSYKCLFHDNFTKLFMCFEMCFFVTGSWIRHFESLFDAAAVTVQQTPVELQTASTVFELYIKVKCSFDWHKESEILTQNAGLVSAVSTRSIHYVLQSTGNHWHLWSSHLLRPGHEDNCPNRKWDHWGTSQVREERRLGHEVGGRQCRLVCNDGEDQNVHLSQPRARSKSVSHAIVFLLGH